MNIRSNLMNFITNCADEYGVVKVVMPSDINIMEDDLYEEFLYFINDTPWPSSAYCSSCNFNSVSYSPSGLVRDDYHQWFPEARTNMLFTQ